MIDDLRLMIGKRKQETWRHGADELPISDWGTDLLPPACSGRLRHTNPISGSRLLAAVVLMAETPVLRNALRRHYEQAAAPNKPNFGGGVLKDKCRRNRQLW